MFASLAQIILGDELCQLFNGFVVLLSRVAISNLFPFNFSSYAEYILWPHSLQQYFNGKYLLIAIILCHWVVLIMY